MKTSFRIIFLLGILNCFVGCSTEKEPAAGGFDVSLEIPSEIILESDAETIDFAVKDGKSPKQSDLMVFDGPDGQKFSKILSVSSTAITVELYTGFRNGDHKISIQRGLDKYSLGSTHIIKKESATDIKPDEGTSIYGRVSCAGEGIQGVVVSDGYEVTVTDANGVYQMDSDKKHGYVFISIPSGYSVPTDVVFPQFFKYTTKSKSAPERHDFELNVAGDQTSFNHLVFGDIHLAARNNDVAQFAELLTDVKELIAQHPNERFYGATLGDMTWDTYWVKNKYSFPEYKKEMAPLAGIQIFQTCGNHDHSLEFAGDFDTMADFKKNLGPSYFSYNIGDVHFVVLDNIECRNPGGWADAAYITGVADEEIEWLKKDLAYVPKDKPVFVHMHGTLYANPGLNNSIRYNMSNTASAASLEQLLDAYDQAHVFTGHTHVMWNADNGNIFDHNAGAVCASWWWTGKLTPGIHIGRDGAPGGYLIVKVNGKDISWQYKGTKRSIDHQFRTFDRNCIDLSAEKMVPAADETHKTEYINCASNWIGASTANEVYINCWNYDPKWKIEVKENGVSLPVTQVYTNDPLHIISYTAKRLGENSSANFITNKFYHFFKVTASSPTSTLEIKVTDRFGNVYTESMKRPKELKVDNYK